MTPEVQAAVDTIEARLRGARWADADLIGVSVAHLQALLVAVRATPAPEAEVVQERTRRLAAEAKVTEMEEALRQPVEVTVKLDTAAIVEAVLAGLKTLPGLHAHTWHEYDGAYYCYGCKTFMPNAEALVAYEREHPPCP